MNTPEIPPNCELFKEIMGTMCLATVGISPGGYGIGWPVERSTGPCRKIIAAVAEVAWYRLAEAEGDYIPKAKAVAHAAAWREWGEQQ